MFLICISVTAGYIAPDTDPETLSMNIFDRVKLKMYSGNASLLGRRTQKPVLQISLSKLGGTKATALRLGLVIETMTSPS